MGFRQVAASADHDLSTKIRRITVAEEHEGVFNPSFGRVGGSEVIAYRAVPLGGTEIRSYVAVRRSETRPFVVTDLTAIGEAQGLARVADPKVVDAGEALYVTFNTGFSLTSTNDIFLIRVTPEIGDLQRVVADFDRQRVEKNWAFALTGDTPRALYRLHPYREVELASGDLGTSHDLHFALRAPIRSMSSRTKAGLTIGTQLVASREGGHRLIAHERWSIKGKRSYFGRAVSVYGIGSDDVHVNVARERLIHRWQDALPRRTAHNRNLLSATYFSGLMHDGDDMILGYGINDAGFAVARVREGFLWQ